MKDRDFLFGATADMVYELDRTAANNGGSRKLTAEEAIKLAEVDRPQLVKRMREEGMIRTDGPRHFLGEAPTRFGWNWWVADLTTGKKLVEGRARTKWGMWRRRYRAYQRVLIAEKSQPASPADPTCQHYVPFGVVCGQCPPRADR